MPRHGTSHNDVALSPYIINDSQLFPFFFVVERNIRTIPRLDLLHKDKAATTPRLTNEVARISARDDAV